MKLLNIDSIPGKKIEAISLARGTVVCSKDCGNDCRAGIKGLLGCEVAADTEMLNEARAIATKRMVDQAEELEADAIVNVRYGSSSLMQGAAEIVAYGTAVKILGDA